MSAIAGGEVVVFAAAPAHVVWRLDGGVPAEVARLPSMVWQLARHDDTVFVAILTDDSQTAILTVPLGGDPPRQLSTHPFGMSEMVVDEHLVWWAAGG
ncbi:MAG: hypothetical protein SFX73_03540 [Kofleriaceae bacterium]|nr:hypothetical protein [Kofleriaceae bacterium]